MSPPFPPSPPDGPPRGTYFSLRKAMQPFPPSPPFTEILASSTNIGHSIPEGAQRKHTPRRRTKKEAGGARAVRHPNGNFSWKPAQQTSSRSARRVPGPLFRHHRPRHFLEGH